MTLNAAFSVDESTPIRDCNSLLWCTFESITTWWTCNPPSHIAVRLSPLSHLMAGSPVIIIHTSPEIMVPCPFAHAFCPLPREVCRCCWPNMDTDVETLAQLIIRAKEVCLVYLCVT